MFTILNALNDKQIRNILINIQIPKVNLSINNLLWSSINISLHNVNNSTQCL